jgi:signal transduction histidine kinase
MLLNKGKRLLRIRIFMLIGVITLLLLPRILDMLIPHDGTVWSEVCSLLISAGVILLIWRQMGRVVVKPLEAMSEAAHRIAEGDLDVTLPKTVVLEVAEVGKALQALKDGLRESVERQSELEQERRFYIGAIAHDLRTPLFSLRGFLSRLQKGWASHPEKNDRYITICREKAEHMERLVSDLFAYVKSDLLDQTMHKERHDFGYFIRRITDEFRPLAASKNVTISVAEPQESGMVEMDAHLVERMIGNLIENAVRYTPLGGQIVMEWHCEQDRVVFAVSDSGPGIPLKELDHIFSPFYRTDYSRNTETGGSGLGLTIAQRILIAHGGSLSVTNLPSSGAKFTGWIPTGAIIE